MNCRLAIALLSFAWTTVAWSDPIAPPSPEKGPERGRGDRPAEDRGNPEEAPQDKGDRGRPDFFARMLRGLDTNKDGSISQEEFMADEKIARLPEDHQKRLFERLDKDHDGLIRRDEIPRGKPDGGRRSFDPNGDGKITFEEFVKNPRVSDLPEERQREIFNKMDTNSDGVLDPTDHRRGRPDQGPDRDRRWDRSPRGMPSFEDLDEDNDGAVTFDEFSKCKRMEDQGEDDREDAFEALDKSGDGRIDRAEFPQASRPEGPAEREPKRKD